MDLVGRVELDLQFSDDHDERTPLVSFTRRLLGRAPTANWNEISEIGQVIVAGGTLTIQASIGATDVEVLLAVEYDGPLLLHQHDLAIRLPAPPAGVSKAFYLKMGDHGTFIPETGIALENDGTEDVEASFLYVHA